MGRSRRKPLVRARQKSQELAARDYTEYTPNSQLKDPLQILKIMGRDLLAARELAWRLIVRDISTQYRQSLLGIIWAFIPPVSTALGLTLAKNANIVNLGVTDIPYPAYVMFSVALWQTFAEAVTSPLQEVSSAKDLLTRISFPREALILAGLGKVFFNFAIKLILIVGLFLWFQIPVTWTVLLTPVALVHLVILGTAIGLFLVPIGALYQDVSKLLTLGLGFWMLLTPVIYPVPTQGTFATLVQLNPVTPLIVTIRELAITGTVSHGQGFWMVSVIAIVGLCLAWLLYRLAIPFVIERISA